MQKKNKYGILKNERGTMARIKIRNVKKLHEVKMLHSFVVARYRESTYVQPEEEFAMADTYESMVEMLNSYPSFQIYAELDKKIIGCAVAVNANKAEGSVWLRTIVVDTEFERKGLAKQLLKKLEKNIRKKGFKRILIESRQRANGFFFRSGYIPYLNVSTSEESLMEKINEEAKALNVVEEIVLNNEYRLKISTQEEVISSEAKKFMKIDPQKIKAEYIFEKLLTKIK